MRPRPAPPTRSLWGQQPFTAQQPQHPLAADVHAMLAAEPGPDLAVALASEGRVLERLADQPH
jgi:hypothetical protein